jgi:hypothetical protein
MEIAFLPTAESRMFIPVPSPPLTTLLMRLRLFTTCLVKGEREREREKEKERKREREREREREKNKERERERERKKERERERKRENGDCIVGMSPSVNCRRQRRRPMTVRFASEMEKEI